MNSPERKAAARAVKGINDGNLRHTGPSVGPTINVCCGR